MFEHPQWGRAVKIGEISILLRLLASLNHICLRCGHVCFRTRYPILRKWPAYPRVGDVLSFLDFREAHIVFFEHICFAPPLFPESTYFKNNNNNLGSFIITLFKSLTDNKLPQFKHNYERSNTAKEGCRVKLYSN